MTPQAAYGLFAQGVLLAALIRFIRVLTGHAKSKPHGLELWMPVMLLLAGSAEGVTFAAHLRGLWGDPSVVSLLVLFLFTLQPSWLPGVPRLGTCVVLMLVALALYAPLLVPIPMVQGGLYELGWRPWPLLLALLVAWTVLRAWRGTDPRWTIIVALALFAYGARVMESDNLWDYLVDPGSLLAMAFLGFTGIWTSLQRNRKGI